MNTPYVFKQCRKCGQILPANTKYFTHQELGKYKLTSNCKKCLAEEQKKKYKRKKGKVRATKDWRKDKDELEVMYVELEMKVSDIAKHFKVTEKTVRGALNYYKINKNNHHLWGDYEIKTFKEMYENPDVSVLEIANYFKTSKKAIYEQAHKNGISRGLYIDRGEKKCSKCGQILPANTHYFMKDSSSKYGLSCYCKDCIKKMAKQKAIKRWANKKGE